MNETFDPYYNWLGIPPHEQPANFYRLLGVQLFEPNLRAIENAAERQMLLLRSVQNGPHGGLSQRLLNEISAARGCLLDAPKRAAYDYHLRQLLSPSLPPTQAPPIALPPSSPVPAPTSRASTDPATSPPNRHVSSRTGRRDQGNFAQHIFMIVLGGVAGLALGVLLLDYFAGTDLLGWSARAQKQPLGSEVAVPPSTEPPIPQEGKKVKTKQDLAQKPSPKETPKAPPPAAERTNPNPESSPPAKAVLVPPPVNPPSETRTAVPAPEAAVSLPDKLAPSKRAEPPSVEIQKKIGEEIAKVFSLEKARSAPEKVAIAKELRRVALETQGKPEERFVLFRRAAELALGGGEFSLAMEYVDEMAKEFEFDAIKAKHALILVAAKQSLNDTQAKAFLQVTKSVAAEETARGQFDEALDLTENACGAIIRAPNKRMRNEASEYLAARRLQNAAWKQFQAASATLQKDADDPAANLAVGRWYAAHVMDWDRALLYFKKCGVKAIQDAAAADRNDLSRPEEVEQAAELWYSVGSKPGEDACFLTRSLYWFKKSQDASSGLAKERAIRRINEIEGNPQFIANTARAALLRGLPPVPSRSADPAETVAPIAVKPSGTGPKSITVKKIAVIKGFDPTLGIMSVVYSPDGKLLAACDNKTVRIWDVAAGAEKTRLHGAAGRVYSLAFSHDGRFLAGGCVDSTIRIWNMEEARLNTTIEGAIGIVSKVQYSPNDALIASHGSKNGDEFRLWGASGKPLGRLDQFRVNFYPKCFTFVPNHKGTAITLLESGRNAKGMYLRLSRVEAPKPSADFSDWKWTSEEIPIGDLNPDPSSAIYSPDGRTLAVLKGDLDLVDIQTAKIRNTLTVPYPHRLRSAAFSPDGSMIVAAGDQITLWNARTGQELHSIKSSYGTWSVDFSSLGNTFAASVGSTVEIWEVTYDAP